MNMNFVAGIIVPPTACVTQPYINTAVFRLHDGTICIIDRDKTEYTFTVSHLYMTWKGIYKWDGTKQEYLTESSAAELLRFSECMGFVIEDDTFVPEGYHVVPQSVECGSPTIMIHTPSSEGARLITVDQVYDLMAKPEHWSLDVYDRYGDKKLARIGHKECQGDERVFGLPVGMISPSGRGLAIQAIEDLNEKGESVIPPLPPYWKEGER